MFPGVDTDKKVLTPDAAHGQVTCTTQAETTSSLCEGYIFVVCKAYTHKEGRPMSSSYQMLL